MRHLRALAVNDSILGKVRRETVRGRDYIVAPIVMIKGDTVLSGSKGALYYPKSEVSRDPHVWNGTPVLLNHPMTPDGRHISGQDPRVLERQQIGWVFNARAEGGDLKGEAWFDVAWCEDLDRRVLISLNEGRPIELSTGLFTDDEPQRGHAANGRSYDFIARNYRPDHLAILLGQTGACSVADGCGVLVNAERRRDIWARLGEALGVTGNAFDEAEFDSWADKWRLKGDDRAKARRAAGGEPPPRAYERVEDIDPPQQALEKAAKSQKAQLRPELIKSGKQAASERAAKLKAEQAAAQKKAKAALKKPVLKKNAFERLIDRVRNSLPGMSQPRSFGRFGPTSGGRGAGPVHRAVLKGRGSVQEALADNAGAFSPKQGVEYVQEGGPNGPIRRYKKAEKDADMKAVRDFFAPKKKAATDPTIDRKKAQQIRAAKQAELTKKNRAGCEAENADLHDPREFAISREAAKEEAVRRIADGLKKRKLAVGENAYGYTTSRASTVSQRVRKGFQRRGSMYKPRYRNRVYNTLADVVQRFTANITSTTKAALTKPVAKLTPEEKRRREMAAEDERTDKKWKQIDLARSRVAAREKAIVEGKRKQAKRLRKPSGTGPTQAAIAYRERISKGLSSGASTRASQDELARELALKRGKGAKKSIDNAYDCTSSAAAAKQKAAAAAEKQRQKNIKAQHKLRKAEAENAGKTRAQLDAEANTRRAQMQRSSTARLAAIKSAPSAPPSVPRGKLTAEVSTKPAAKPELTSRQKRDADLASDRQRFEAQQRAARAKAVKEAEASGATAYGDRIRKARAEGHPGLKKKQPPVAVPGSR